MKKKNYSLSIDKIIALILMLTLSTLALIIRIYFENLGKIVQQVLFYFGFFGLGFVVLAILFYYLAKASSWLRKDQVRIGVMVAIILAFTHSLFSGLSSEKFWYSFLGYIAGDGVIIIVGLFIFLKWKNKKQNSSKLK